MNAKHVWTISGLTLMAAILFGTSIFGVMPTLVAIQSIDSQRNAIVQENLARTAFLEKLKTTAADKEALFLTVSAQRDLFPDKLNAVEFINELNDASVVSGAKITDLSIQPTQVFNAPANTSTSAEYAKAIGVLAGSTLSVGESTMTVQGTLSNIQTFIDKLHTGSRYVLVYKAVFANGTGASASDVVAVDLSAQIFTLR